MGANKSQKCERGCQLKQHVRKQALGDEVLSKLRLLLVRCRGRHKVYVSATSWRGDKQTNRLLDGASQLKLHDILDDRKTETKTKVGCAV